MASHTRAVSPDTQGKKGEDKTSGDGGTYCSPHPYSKLLFLDGACAFFLAGSRFDPRVLGMGELTTESPQGYDEVIAGLCKSQGGG